MPLTPPPRDESGHVEPHDHPGIKSEDGIIRRIAGNQWVYDPKVPGKRASTAAFRASSGEKGGMSVDLQALIEEARIDPKRFVMSPPWIGAVRFEAGYLRSLGCMVGYDPVAGNDYHGEVWGKFTKSLQRTLVATAQVFVLPEE